MLFRSTSGATPASVRVATRTKDVSAQAAANKGPGGIPSTTRNKKPDAMPSVARAGTCPSQAAPTKDTPVSTPVETGHLDMNAPKGGTCPAVETVKAPTVGKARNVRDTGGGYRSHAEDSMARGLAPHAASTPTVRPSITDDGGAHEQDGRARRPVRPAALNAPSRK